MLQHPADPSRELDAAPAPSSGGEFYVVGIGASAGGLGALRTFFSTVPSQSGIAWVVVVHLSPDHESHLVELLQPYCRMPIEQVAGTVPLVANRVYVIPPNANLNTIDTHLRLSDLEARRFERAPIDHFLRTLAETHDGTAIGVILTGAGSDGALGLRQIKERGGLTLVQDPIEAEFDSMPRAAIATGMADVVAPVRQMADHIVRFCATHPQIGAVPSTEPAGHDDTLAELLLELRRRTGHDFGLYTPRVVLRRVARRMQLHHEESLGRYLGLVRAEPQEADALASDLLTSVREFFSDRTVFDALEHRVLPRIFDRKRAGDRVRAWTIGCANGEEAYSLGMLLLEEAERRTSRPQVQVFSSDSTDEMLSRARAGVYPREVASFVSPERLGRFFAKDDGQYRIQDEVRNLVVFAAHDLFRDPPFGHLDLIMCRSLLGDLQPDVRAGVLDLFHFALNPDGVLVVGERDLVDARTTFVRDAWSPRIFVRVGEAPAGVRGLGVGRPRRRRSLPAAVAAEPDRFEPAEVFRRAVEHYAPPSLLVDDSGQVLYYSPGAAVYLRIGGGELRHNLLALVHSVLAPLVQTGLEAVAAGAPSWASDRVAVPTEHGPRQIVLRVERVVGAQGAFVLVVFDHIARETPDARQLDVSSSIAKLVHELDDAKTRIDAWRQATATPPDGVQAGAEIDAVIAEINRAKDELDAVNATLMTLHRDNQHRLAELSRLSDDLRHLLESTGIAIVFLDPDLQIVRFTPQLAHLFDIRATDTGRPFAAATRSLKYYALADDVRRVMRHEAPFEREVEDSRGLWFLMRMVPYRIALNLLHGVVVSFIDITDRKRAEAVLIDADRRKDEFIALLAHELRNPLAPISAGVEVLKTLDGNGALEHVTTVLERQTRQLVRLVDDLLEVSRITSGRFRLKRSRVSVAEVVHDAVASVRPLIDRLAHQLTVEVGDAPLWLDADAARITQVLTNLLHNAARYTPGGGRIAVTAAAEDGDAVITVRDDGVGIDAGDLGRVFEMFYRGTQTELPRDAGLGIGLALAKRLIELHGGTLSARSDGRGRGSEFVIRLRLAAAEADAAPPDDDAPAARADGLRVLVVDDNEDAANMLGLQIESLGGTTVRVAMSGRDALAEAETFAPHLVLLDLGMPIMDGYEVARRLTAAGNGQRMRLVAVTGWSQEEHLKRTREAGFHGHLTKPASREAIAAMLAEAAALR